MRGPAGNSAARTWLGRAIDSVVSELSPTAGLRRQAARNMQAAVTGYEVARSDYSRRSPSLPGGGADQHQPEHTLRQLRELCHSHDRNGSVFSGLLDRARDNIVGSEFRWQVNSGDEALNADVNAYVAARARPENADSRGQESLVDQCAMALRAMFTEGDQLWAFGDDDAIHCYEADQLVGFRNPKTAREKSVVNGVELDDRGRAAGFWVADRKYGPYVASGQAQRIDAADCTWICNRKRRSQTRGIPALASGLSLYERFDAYLDNETFAAEINSMLAFFIEDDPTYTEAGTSIPGLSTETRDDATTRVLERLERGQIVEVRRGSRVKPFASERPGSNFTPYIKAVLSLLGSAVGMPLILVLLDFSEVNYSSARAALLEARKAFRRWQFFVQHRMFMPVYRRWVTQGIGRRAIATRPEALNVTVRFPGWEWVDPLKEVQADSRAVAAGFKSFSEVCEARGRSFPEVCQERENDEKTLLKHKITARLDIAGGPVSTPEMQNDGDSSEKGKQGAGA